ncbi:thioesterase II family protein [Streptomyces hawaiiensis]|uniref:thioesterase II family protein n=1 Tax=Streptomyces hawaiiensis TaxID=67305 RepID=UPI00365063A3
MSETATDPAVPAAGTGTGWLRLFHRAHADAPRLVCFPHAGGSASFYFPLSAALAPGAEVLAVQYPGRQDRRGEPCVDSIPALADAVVGELRQRQDRALALFGHSMGSSLAFEVARRLEAEGSGPTALIVSGRRSPRMIRDEGIHRADDDVLIAHLARLSGTDARILGDPEMLELILPAMRADYRAAETYRYTPGPPLRCSLSVLTGDDDPQLTPAEARDWATHTTGTHELTVLPGGHFYLASHWSRVAELIRERLG